MEFVVRPRPRGNMFLPAVVMLLMASGLHAVRIENVTIPSQGAVGGFTSGPWTLQGELLLPEGASAQNPVPAVLLVAGAGAFDRFQCTTTYYKSSGAGNCYPPGCTPDVSTCIFAEVTKVINNAGFAALIYDKRNCDYIPNHGFRQCPEPPQGSRKWCTNTTCTTSTLQKKGLTLNECKQLTAPTPACNDKVKISFDDYVADAAAAINFLKDRADITSSRISMLTHSQGGDVAPQVAAMVKTSTFHVESLILLNGFAVGIQQGLQKLFELMSTWYLPGVAGPNAWSPMTSSGYPNLTMVQQTAMKTLAEKKMTDADWTAVNSAQANTTFQNGFGVHPAYFWTQWQDASSKDTKKAYINSSGVEAVFVYNSPGDRAVPPQLYAPLHQLLDEIVVPATDSRGLSSTPLAGTYTYPHDPTNLRVAKAEVPGLMHEGFSIYGWSNARAEAQGCQPPSQMHIRWWNSKPEWILPTCSAVTNTVRGFMSMLPKGLAPSPAVPPTPPSPAVPPTQASADSCDDNVTKTTWLMVLITLILVILIACCTTYNLVVMCQHPQQAAVTRAPMETAMSIHPPPQMQTIDETAPNKRKSMTAAELTPMV